MKKENKKKRANIVEQLIEGFEKDWSEKRQELAENLHNDLVEVIAEHRPDKYTTLFVIEMIKTEVMKEEYEKLFAPALSAKSPKPITE